MCQAESGCIPPTRFRFQAKMPLNWYWNKTGPSWLRLFLSRIRHTRWKDNLRSVEVTMACFPT